MDFKMEFWLEFDAALHFSSAISSGAQEGLRRMESIFEMRLLACTSAKSFSTPYFD